MYVSKIIDAVSLIRDPEQSSGMVTEVLARVNDLRDFYPRFDDWLAGKVLPGLVAGERTLLVEYRDGLLAALAVVKDDGLEKKLCCLRVFPGYQNSHGLGIRMFHRAFDVLGTDKPVLSVAEERLPVFDRIFDHFGFELAAEYQELYRPGRSEFAFNGELTANGHVDLKADHLAVSTFA